MARIDTNRSVAIPYRPGMAPGASSSMGDAMQAVWVELNRIAQSLADTDQPMGAAIRATESLVVTVAPTITWERIFDESITNDWRNPANAFNAATGVYTVPQDGVYQVVARLSAPAFPTPAVKGYALGLRGTIHFVNGTPNQVATTFMGGQDTLPLGCIGTFMQPLVQGDQFWIDAAAVRETTGGTLNNVLCVLEVSRVSGIGNNTAS